MMAKKTIIFLLFLMLTIPYTSTAAIQDTITFTSIPAGLDLLVGENAGFDVTLKNSGPYADVTLQFRNLPDGIAVVEGTGYHLIDMNQASTRHVVLSVDENVEPGIYEFEIADNSNSDAMSWTVIKLAILNVGDSPVYNIIEVEDVDEETEDVIPEINEVDVKEITNSTEQEDDDSITEESSDSIMDTAVVLTYTELSIAAVVEAISITIINLTLVAVVGIVRKRKRETSTDTTKDENAAVDNDIGQDDDVQENYPDGEYDNEDNTE
ncbi:MAG: hypothetical protein KAH86_01210 [Methanosarcinales archaeon]|nr:hypothetical protein [Methanosarcinales archaeon]